MSGLMAVYVWCVASVISIIGTLSPLGALNWNSSILRICTAWTPTGSAVLALTAVSDDTGKPGALKGARPVWGGADRKVPILATR